ncbi:hypothetical protein ISCGN_029963 [Ixodes scapularis]
MPAHEVRSSAPPPPHTEVSYKKVDLFNVQGLLLQQDSFDRDKIRKVLWFKPLPGDIFVGSYPRSCSTLAQYIIWSLFHEGKPLPDFHTLLTKEFPCIEVVDADTVSPRNGSPRLVKHHLPQAFSPSGADGKHVVVLRNPFDVCASNYVHLGKSYEGKFSDFFECFTRGEVAFGDYFDHVLSWYERRDDPNVLLLCYEEMRKDPIGSVRKVAEFVGVEASEDRLVQVARDTGLEVTVAGRSHLEEEVVKGTVGCFKEFFSEEQHRILADIIRDRFAGTDLLRVWAEFL